MKKTLTIITLLAGAVSGYSQGEILFSAYDSTLKIAVYGTQTQAANYTATYGGYTVNETVGNSATTTTSAESPAGTTAYAAGSALSGTGYLSELLVGPAGSTLANAATQGVGLVPFGGASQTGGAAANFFTGNARHIGFINSTEVITLPTASYYAGGSTVSVAIAAWSSAYSTLALAQQAEQQGVAGAFWGVSPVVQMTALPVSPASAENIPGTLESFSLGTSVPEPSTVALGVMGVSALLFRRKK